MADTKVGAGTVQGWEHKAGKGKDVLQPRTPCARK